VWYEAMMEFSIESCLRFGWETFKRRPWFFVGSGLLIALAYVIAGSISGGIDWALSGSPDQPTTIGYLVELILSTLISMGVAAFYLNAHDNPETVSLSSLWHPRPFLKYLAVVFLLGLAIALGFILLIVPGIIFALMFIFASLIVIDREAGPIDAMKESKRITHGHKWSLLGFILVLTGINLLGLLALVVGLLVSIPVSTLAFVHAYRTLGGAIGARDASLPV
jgi:uncharacterized membrane protein